MPSSTLDFRAMVMRALWEKNMTITDLADQIHCSRGHLSRVLNGKADSPDTEQAIREYLNIKAA